MSENNNTNNLPAATFPKTRLPKNLANYQWVRQRTIPIDEFQWVRIGDLKGLDLPKPVVLVTGGFDLLTASHMRLLFEARARAGTIGTVLVAMNSDDSISARKGTGLPILTFAERVAALAYMPIDIVVEFDTEKELRRISNITKPVCQVAGQEYMNKNTTAGVPLFCIHEGGPHTSEIVGRIKKLRNEDTS
jgi:bifunctional ADP-heptose synthase (sugar kinase/adenylyltransferase)